MALLIDGYNLLHATGLVGRRQAGLQGSREALLRFLASAVPPEERSRTTIVFDAAEAPPGLPRSTVFEDITVRYAAEYHDADELLEELIAQDRSPRSLLVVSSDHRVQRAARRRRANFTDSDRWFADAVRRRRPPGPPPTAVGKASIPLTADEVNYWLAEFESAADEPEPGKTEDQPERRPPDHASPFPPGYAEDLLDSP